MERIDRAKRKFAAKLAAAAFFLKRGKGGTEDPLKPTPPTEKSF
jgi:hypothetical protein